LWDLGRAGGKVSFKKEEQADVFEEKKLLEVLGFMNEGITKTFM